MTRIEAFLIPTECPEDFPYKDIHTLEYNAFVNGHGFLTCVYKDENYTTVIGWVELVALVHLADGTKGIQIAMTVFPWYVDCFIRTGIYRSVAPLSRFAYIKDTGKLLSHTIIGVIFCENSLYYKNNINSIDCEAIEWPDE